jgi:hypothetical protein
MGEKQTMNTNQNNNAKSGETERNQGPAKHGNIPGVTAEVMDLACMLELELQRAMSQGLIQPEKDGNQFRAKMRYLVDLKARMFPEWFRN